MIGNTLDSFRKSLDAAKQTTIVTQDLTIIPNSPSNKALGIALREAAKRVSFFSKDLAILANLKTIQGLQTLVKTLGNRGWG